MIFICIIFCEPSVIVSAAARSSSASASRIAGVAGAAGRAVPAVAQGQAELLRLRMGSAGDAFPPLDSRLQRMAETWPGASIPRSGPAPREPPGQRAAARFPAARNMRDRTSRAARSGRSQARSSTKIEFRPLPTAAVASPQDAAKKWMPRRFDPQISDFVCGMTADLPASRGIPAPPRNTDPRPRPRRPVPPAHVRPCGNPQVASPPARVRPAEL